MTHTLLIEVPEELYETLVKSAEETGEPPEKLVVQWLTTATHYLTDDPVEEFIGAFSSGIPDLAEQHDKYIGEALMEELRDEQAESDRGA